MNQFSRICVVLYFCLEYIVHRIKFLLYGTKDIDQMSVHGKVAIVTGANTGIGKEVSRQLAQKGCTVVLGCRNLVQGGLAIEDIHKTTGCPRENLILRELDLADLSSVRKFGECVGAEFPEIHLLVNNAGVYFDCDERKYTKDGFEIHMGVNHLGHFLLTHLLLNNLIKAAPSRVVIVSSTNQLVAELKLDDLMMERTTNNGLLNMMPYSNSKLANALFAMELANRLQGTGVNTYSVCPGLVYTEVFRNFSSARKFIYSLSLQFFGLSAEQGAYSVLMCALSRKLSKESGHPYRLGERFQSASRQLCATMARRLWNQSELLVGISAN